MSDRASFYLGVFWGWVSAMLGVTVAFFLWFNR